MFIQYIQLLFKCFSTNSVSLLLLIVIFSIQELLERLCRVYEQEVKDHYNNFTGTALSSLRKKLWWCHGGDSKFVTKACVKNWGHKVWNMWVLTRQGGSMKDTTKWHYGNCRILCFWSLTYTSETKSQDIWASADKILTVPFLCVSCMSPSFLDWDITYLE